MSVQDKVERTLRQMYVLFSKSEPYEKETDKVIVDKKEVIALLNELKMSMSEMMEEYEITLQSRDKGERKAKRHGADIIADAENVAEDIYAASVIYSDNALESIQEILQETNDELDKVFRDLKRQMKEKQRIVKENQLELKSSLGDMKDTNKYLSIIEDNNRKRQKAKETKNAKWGKEKEDTGFSAIKPEIKINPEYFEKIGKPLEQEVSESEEVFSEAAESQELSPEEKAAQEMQIKVNLDAEYFKWKNKQQAKK